MNPRNVGSKRRATDDREVPAELARREAQDRAKPSAREDGAKSPVDSMHVDAPKRRHNAAGERETRREAERKAKRDGKRR